MEIKKDKKTAKKQAFRELEELAFIETLTEEEEAAVSGGFVYGVGGIPVLDFGKQGNLLGVFA